MIFTPKYVDLTPTGRIVPKAEIGGNGYGENTEYQLQKRFVGKETVIIDYYGEDGTWLSDVVPNYQDKILKLFKKFNGY